MASNAASSAMEIAKKWARIRQEREFLLREKRKLADEEYELDQQEPASDKSDSFFCAKGKGLSMRNMGLISKSRERQRPW